jgi:hypothetical protein
VLLRLADSANQSTEPASIISETVSSLLQQLLEKASKEGILTVEEAGVMLQHIRSYCLWSAPELVGGNGAADVACSSVINTLKVLGDAVDPLSMDNIAVARGRGRVQRPLKTACKTDPLPFISKLSKLQSFAVSLRIWVLLAQWSLPLTTDQV